MNFYKPIACICEGGAERAIIELLIENGRLPFQKKDLLNNEIIRSRKAKEFEKNYLRKNLHNKITVLRILDSRKEAFKLSKPYKDKVDVINVITSPEIEILIIISEGKYADFTNKGNLKASEYCKRVLKFKAVKNDSFIYDYFSDTNKLTDAIKEYKMVKKLPPNEVSIADLLK